MSVLSLWFWTRPTYNQHQKNLEKVRVCKKQIYINKCMQTGWKYNQYFYTNFPFTSVYIKSGNVEQEYIQIQM